MEQYLRPEQVNEFQKSPGQSPGEKMFNEIRDNQVESHIGNGNKRSERFPKEGQGKPDGPPKGNEVLVCTFPIIDSGKQGMPDGGNRAGAFEAPPLTTGPGDCYIDMGIRLQPPSVERSDQAELPLRRPN